MKLYWAKVKENAIIPTKREEDAGYDLYPCFEEEDLENEIGFSQREQEKQNAGNDQESEFRRRGEINVKVEPIIKQRKGEEKPFGKIKEKRQPEFLDGFPKGRKARVVMLKGFSKISIRPRSSNRKEQETGQGDADG